MDAIASKFVTFVTRAIEALQTGTSTDIFFAMHCVALLPGCPTCPEAVTTVKLGWIGNLMQQHFQRALQQYSSSSSSSSSSSTTLPIISTMAGSSNGDDASTILSDWSKLLGHLAFCRIVELHLAESSPSSPFATKKVWYSAAKAMMNVTEETLKLALMLLKRALASSRHGMTSGVIAVASAVLLRAAHVEHIVEKLRGADTYLSQTLQSLEVFPRHARDMFTACNAYRSIDALAVHCPFFVVIAAAVMDKITAPVKKQEKERREERFVDHFPAIRSAEESALLRDGVLSVPSFLPQQQQLGGGPSPGLGLPPMGGGGFGGDVSNQPSLHHSPSGAGGGGASAHVPEFMPEWTHFMMMNRRRRRRGREEEEDGSGGHMMMNNEGDSSNTTEQQQHHEGLGVGAIPPGILEYSRSLFLPTASANNNDGGDDDDATEHHQDVEAAVNGFVRVFVAGRLAQVQISGAAAGSADKGWTNASDAFSSCSDAHAAPFAEMATVARLRMGHVPVRESTLRSLGATVLEDVSLALRCGHPLAFEAAIADASGELAERGLLASLMTLRTHAMMMLVKKYLHSNSAALETKRLCVEDFVNRYRSQLPPSLLDTELQVLVPLILGNRMKARMEDQTLVMAPEPFTFDS